MKKTRYIKPAIDVTEAKPEHLLQDYSQYELYKKNAQTGQETNKSTSGGTTPQNGSDTQGNGSGNGTGSSSTPLESKWNAWSSWDD